MRTNVVGAAGLGLLSCDAFVVLPPQQNVLASQQQQQQLLARLPSSTSPSTASPRRPLLMQGSREGVGVRRARRTRNKVSRLSMSSFDAAGDAAAARAVPMGPGAGVIDLKFENLKTGGFKVFLLLFLLGQGRAADNDHPFSVRDTPEGIRVLIGDETKNESQWEGVLDLSWGVEPTPFFRVDRIDVNEVIPYPGELYILNKLLDAIIDVNGEQAVDEYSKLFMFREGEQNQLANAKSTLASMAAL
eukprot:g12030.t1